MIKLGLTGSIGMGKTTTAGLFRAQNIAVYDADAVVHALYEGEAADALQPQFGEAIVDGRVDRAILSKLLAEDPGKMARLEAIIHPLVRQKQQAFLTAHQNQGDDIVVLDIPLLFETGGEALVDAVIVVSCDRDIQRQRVLARPGWTSQKLDMVLARQMPDAEKRKRADYIIETGQGLDVAETQVAQILQQVRQRFSS